MRSAIKRPNEEETNLGGFQLFKKLNEEEFNRLNYEKTCSLYKSPDDRLFSIDLFLQYEGCKLFRNHVYNALLSKTFQ